MNKDDSSKKCACDNDDLFLLAAFQMHKNMSSDSVSWKNISIVELKLHDDDDTFKVPQPLSKEQMDIKRHRK